MARSAADLTALKAELTNDPNELGLVAPPAIDDVGNADKLNEVLEAQQVDRRAIPAQEIACQVDREEYNALSAADRAWLAMITASGSLDANDFGQVKQGLLQCFGAETETRAGLASLLTEAVNRIEQMFRQGLLEVGGTVSPSDVANARNLP